MKETQALIDLAFPFRGPCAFCGHPDARHRIFDAIKGMISAGDSVAEVADDYGVSPEVVRAILSTTEN